MEIDSLNNDQAKICGEYYNIWKAKGITFDSNISSWEV